jgi:hypothetical protein
MPNTLAHIGLQGTLNASSVRHNLFAWVLLACVIPDVPWIFRRVAAIAMDVDPLTLHAYTTVQATLAFSMLLSLGLAVFATRIFIVWLLLAGNSALHLLLDAVEIKPGNGVHFFAPVSWELTTFAWTWPEHWLVKVSSALGLLLVVALLAAGKLRAPPPLALSLRRLTTGALILTAYFSLPIAFLEGPLQANHQYVQTLARPDERSGKPVAFDRAALVTRTGVAMLMTDYGEFRLLADGLPTEGVVSFRGRFIDNDTIRATDVHINESGFRDLASILGIVLIGAIWAKVLHGSLRRRSQSKT